MSKSSTSRGFRKVDVDQYDEDNFKDEVDDVQDTGPNEQEVSNFLLQGNNLQAFKAALLNPPIHKKNPPAQEAAAQLVMRVLSSMKASEIQSAVDSCDADTLDVLAKYIYKCFALGPDGQSCASLLTWHEKVVAKGGVGCIVRVLTDRKRL
ncbi:actin-related protein 2/3 complex subunit 5-A-like [Styela clava]|uniref:actin-related protein 2/3 complex subunit 5-A-like n=1 Tax=Styela clava TaxID=7725 RepID=UPI00193A8D1E|nr:actin-related protein 2/3 complex subunit 5-A-like [Styela clava]